MSLLDEVTNSAPSLPPRIVIHGRGGAGKSTFGASIPGAVFLPLEDGLSGLTAHRFPTPTTFVEVLAALAALLPMKHKFQALVIDTVDHLEQLIWAHTCKDRSDAKKTFETIEDFGYGKGYMFCDPHWVRLFRGLDALRRAGMTVCVLAHNHTEITQDPKIGAYERISPKLHKRANSLLYEWADIVGCLEVERCAVEREGAKGRTISTSQTTGQRILYTEDSGTHLAKSRYRIPPVIPIPIDVGFPVLMDQILKSTG